MFLDLLTTKLKESKALFLGEETAFRSAVLVPLVQKDGEWHVLFEVRAFNMRKQPGDISFPGGGIDPDDASPCAAALRETSEELGIDASKIQVIGELSPLVMSPSFVIYPFVGVVNIDELNINADEVEEVFLVPVKWLRQYEPYLHLVTLQPTPSEDFPFEKIANGKDYKWGTRAMEEWFYDYDRYTIWGLTAKILKYFTERIK